MANSINFTGETLRAMVIASANSLEKKQEFLDSINVFPIPDGDTGLNLTSTLRRVVKELESCSQSTIFDVAKTISKGSFLGAKGNSGVILSQFMMGMTSKLQDHEQITPIIFAKAMINGSDWAYRAVLNPREGTILTVVRDASKAAYKKAEQTGDWLEVITEAYQMANTSTKETPNLLPVLKDAGVVDAGAQGFVYIIGSWLLILAEQLGESLPQSLIDHIQATEEISAISPAFTVDSSDTFTFQYCTECIILDPKIEVNKLKEQLEEYGDSLFCVSSEIGIKIHIHTDVPEEIFSLAGSYGELTSEKVDDMKEQHTSKLKLDN
ncbi:MAG: DAK2 domain-containing protein [Candidatus Kariarchaeaceae archaeon]